MDSQLRVSCKSTDYEFIEINNGLYSIDEISQALKLMDMIPDGKYCCDMTIGKIFKCKYEGVFDNCVITGKQEWAGGHHIKNVDCPKPYKGETE